MQKHEDKRRLLIDWETDSKTAKTVIAKTDCELGNHFHREKIEYFMLVYGSAKMTLTKGGIGAKDTDMEIGTIYTVMPRVQHTFRLKKGSVLMCLCSHVFDEKDEIRT